MKIRIEKRIKFKSKSKTKMRLCVFLTALIPLLLGGSICLADQAGEEFFEKQVRPILVARCQECHSGRIAMPKGGLRLDSRAAALQGGDTGPAIVPGNVKQSLLVEAINYGELYQMPPKSRLPADEIAVLTKWVEMGAPWPADVAAAILAGPTAEFDLAKRKADHWCWQPIKPATPPNVKNESWVKQPLDRFILAKLEERGLAFASPADERTLVRRAYFDLVGLPPSLEDVSAFAPSPPLPVTPSATNERESGREGEGERKYEAIVEKLLASPHFGERWGRHWLDLVRYAESRGHEFDYNIPNAFEYRDYVIRALNADVPYDRFVTEHVAGDLLQQPRLHPREGFNESIIGTGFWFLGEWCHSPVDIRKDECDRVDNMLDVFSKTFLGVTVACARCHDHKFDAISQRDYYALAGYLQSSSYRLARFETWQKEREIAAELASLDSEYRPRIATALGKLLRPKVAELAQKMSADLDNLKNELGVWEVDLQAGETIVDYANTQTGVWITDGPTFGAGPIRVGQIVLSGDAAAPLEVATYGAARRESAWGDLGLAATSENDPARLGGWLRAGRTLKTATFTLQSGYLHYLIEGVGHVYAVVDSHTMINGPLHAELLKETGGNSDLPARWITHDLSRYVGHRVHVEFSPNEDEDLRVLMVVDGRDRPAAPATRPNALLGVSGPGGLTLIACHELVSATLDALAADQIGSAERPRDCAAIANWLIANTGVGNHAPTELNDLIAEYTAARDKLVGKVKHASRLCLAMWDGTPVDESLLIRGNHKTVGPVVPRQLLTVLQESEGTHQKLGGSGRLELARQLVDRRNPLVSRVIVNRVWHHLLGRGIVPSVDNFGVLGTPPTHLELLDYLADEFVRDGWSIKRLIRRIMLSSTYRQSSGARGQESGASGAGFQTAMKAAEVADPQNDLFHRQNLKRLEGESIRDAILAVSGSLDRKMYGPSVPVYLTPFMQGRGRPKDSGPLDGSGRRSIYTAVRRNFLSPMMLAFDTPIPFTTIGRRNTSNVPAQALILMNDPFVAEQARLWARNLLADKAASPPQRVRRMYLEALSREPSAAETTVAIAFLDQQAREQGVSDELARRDEREWADLGHVMYNSKEFIFIE
jgi:Protein of unknown function (DUF1553)/Protein of unknown function (DUF1549)/Planctomycete cytochrome C